jgi:glutamine amidotransferase
MIAIIEYKAGNIESVRNAVRQAGHSCIVTSDEQQLRRADKVILPGVGHAAPAMQQLKEAGQQPILGICLGMQLFCRYSEEGNTDCLGIFDNVVRHFPATGIVPHMGWNTLTDMSSPLLEGVLLTDDVYFVHSYYVEPGIHTVATCDYLLPFSAALQRDNFFATQFHPEKSGAVGKKIFNNFLSL